MSTVERSLYPFRDVTLHVITRQKHYIVLFTILSIFYASVTEFTHVSIPKYTWKYDCAIFDISKWLFSENSFVEPVGVCSLFSHSCHLCLCFSSKHPCEHAYCVENDVSTCRFSNQNFLLIVSTFPPVTIGITLKSMANDLHDMYWNFVELLCMV